MTDWIEGFLEYTKDVNSPEIFRLWSAIGAVSGVLERRVWLEGTNNTQIFPNLFILLVGGPGTGKSQSVMPIKALWHAAKELVLAPDSMTRASLLDEMEAGSRAFLHGKGLYDYHSLLVSTDEIGTLLPVHDIEIMAVLSALYDCRENYRESRRHVKKITDISRPHLTILAGAQPGFLATLPEIAWSQGFAARLNMVYSGDPIISPIIHRGATIDRTDENRKRFDAQLAPLKDMIKLYGQFTWDEDAADAFATYAMADCPPKPKHSKLEHYNRRRSFTLAKLCAISAVARTSALNIHLWDFERAKCWLLGSEGFMPDIFRAMKNKSDAQVLEELHIMMWDLYVKSGKPVHKNTVWHFMKDRLPGDKIYRVLETGMASGMFKKKVNEDLYIPLPLAQHGME